MSSVSEHYAEHLGPVYAWMAGGIESAIERGATELNVLGLSSADGGLVVDLGAGFGMHAIPLARQGHPVLAIDSCAALLDELRVHGRGLPIEVVEDDLLAFRRHLHGRPRAILCMGDTLTHLDSTESVLRLFAEVASALDSGGHFLATFRDYSTALTGDQRFIPVRSDEGRILTCFLEYVGTHVVVHDVLHQREGSAWKMRVSSYRKLRLSLAWLVRHLESLGLSARHESGMSGMVRLVARRA